MKKRTNPKIEAMRERSLMLENERTNYERKYSLNEQVKNYEVRLCDFTSGIEEVKSEHQWKSKTYLHRPIYMVINGDYYYNYFAVEEIKKSNTILTNENKDTVANLEDFGSCPCGYVGDNGTFSETDKNEFHTGKGGGERDFIETISIKDGETSKGISNTVYDGFRVLCLYPITVTSEPSGEEQNISLGTDDEKVSKGTRKVRQKI